ncbi:MAG: TonB-dependent receptor [Tannerella sp.]|jgi:TonB-linked SusC/RagA family outer membrane protein|nr:TonB-dependent receptor [Tannerella sp.]
MKRNPLLTHYLCIKTFKDIPRIMKISMFFLFICVFQLIASNSEAQNAIVTLSSNKITYGELIKEIEKQTDYLVVYSNSEINSTETLRVKNKTSKVSDFLADVISADNSLKYEFENDYIVLSKKMIFNTAQQTGRRITGKILDNEGEPISGASIVETGTTNGTITDIDGNYSLLVQGDPVLRISYIGYTVQEVESAGKNEINIILTEDTQALEEVVVVGYGTVRKRDLTGSVGSLDAGVISAASVTTAVGAMQGKIAGVNIEKNVARPGGSYNITVRGLSSINNNSGPLYVIDGIPTTADMNDLNPSDIEKIDVLKDASATAIYGSRGANGVIIVTTKRGKEGRFSIQYDGNVGFRVASNLPDMMNGEEYVQFRTDLYNNMGRSTDRSNADFFTADEWAIIDNGNYTDWIDLVLRTGLQTSNTVTASGGDEKGTFSIGLGQLKEEGTIHGQDYNRYNMHLNVNRKFLNVWEAGGSLYFTHSVQNEGSYETLRSAYRLPPVATPYDEDGNLAFYVYRNDAVSNPMLEYSEDGEHRENRRFRAFGNLYLQVEPIAGLTLRSQIAPHMIYKRNATYIGVNAKNSNGKTESTTATYLQNNYWSYVLDNQINYAKNIDKHNFNVNFVHSIQFEQTEESNQAARNLPYNSKWYNLDAATMSDITSSTTDYTQASMVSFLGRLQYSWDSRYLLTVSGRYDGSSRLAEGNKWAFFPSAALAWHIGEEDFLKSFEKLSHLKLRVSYGMTGNDAVAIYGTQSGVSQMYYDFGGTASTSYYKSGLANQNLTWEKTYEINAGLDYGFFNNRLSGSFDIYQRDAKDLIMKRNLPSTSGWSSVWDNIGWVRNRGLEIGLNTMNIVTKDFSWATNVIFDANKNEIIELYGEKNDDVGNKWFIGQPVRVNYDYVFDGIWQESEAAEAAKYNQKPGQVKVKDLDNNGVIDANDKKVIGQRDPKWTGSITNTFTYRNFDFSFNVYTRQGAQLQSTFLSAFMSLEGNYKNLDVDYWTPENPSNKYPQPGNKGQYFDALRYNDVSFVRVGDITLGYTLPKKVLNKMNIKNLRVYFTTNNPFTFTSYKGYDPEWATQNTWGESTGYTTYLLGLKLEF